MVWLPRLARPLLAGICIVCAGHAHAQGRLEARYVMSVGGITIGQGTWVVEVQDEQYTASATGQVTGVLRAVTSGGGYATARGLTSGGRLTSTGYVIQVTADDQVDQVRMGLKAGVVKDLFAEPPLIDAPDRVHVTEAHLRAVTDPLTAGLAVVAGSGDMLAPESCQRTLPIFDGRQRFDLVLSFKRVEQAREVKGYGGPLLVCRVDYRPVAGHRTKRFAVKYLMERQDIEVALAPIAGTRVLVPVRIEFPTLIGTAVLSATEFVSVAQPGRAKPARPTGARGPS
jgi:hypothetical protein